MDCKGLLIRIVTWYIARTPLIIHVRCGLTDVKFMLRMLSII